jgi:predicted membrane GTPase involved in stress response
MVVGLHSRDNDLVVNPVKTKQLTNIRASMLLTPPIRHTLESAVEFIADDELVEITPSASAQAPAARARAQTRLPRRRLRKSPPAGGGQVTGWWEPALT